MSAGDSDYFCILFRPPYRVPYLTSQPWYEKNDTDLNNERAQKAYTAMLTVTPKQPNDNEYTRVSNEVSGYLGRGWDSVGCICMEMDAEANLRIFADFFCFFPVCVASSEPFSAGILMHTQFPCTFPLSRSLFCMRKDWEL